MDFKTWWQQFDPISQTIFICLGIISIALGIGAMVGTVTPGLVFGAITTAIILGVIGGIIRINAAENQSSPANKKPRR